VRPALRWALVTAVLAFTLAVALSGAPWPVVHRPGIATSPAGAQRPSGSADIDQLRSRAALEPCPAPATNPAPTGPRGRSEVLIGLMLPCLGQPGTVDLAAAFAGRSALLNLWGPGCQPCTQELPALAAYAAEPDAVQVVGVEVQGQPEGALTELASLGVHYPCLSDPDGRLRAALAAPPVIPLSYVVFPDGRVSQINPPEVMRSPQQVRTVVARYLGPGASR
jgi:thiol-disulfide isomerase/thioredoxin